MNKRRYENFTRNYQVLKKRFPRVALVVDQEKANDSFLATLRVDQGHRPTLCIRNAGNPPFPLYTHEALDALLKRVALTEPPEPFDMVFIIGMGLGEACLEAIQQYKNKPRIVVIEPHASLFWLAMPTEAFGKILEYDRLSIYVGSQANAEQIVEDSNPVLPVGRNLLFIYPYRMQPIAEKIRQFENSLKDHIRVVRQIWKTTRLFGKRMLKNSLANLPSLLDGTPLRVLRHRLKGKPILCVAAGPSLEEALPLLKKIDNTVILACDSAVGSLFQAGIKPHIVATTDIHPSNIKKFEPYVDRLHESALAFAVEANPENIKIFPGTRRVGMTSYSRLVLDWMNESLQLDCQLPVTSTVANFAVLLSIAMGAEPIVLVGVDQAYLQDKSHASGSVKTTISSKEQLFPVKSVNGGTVYAPSQLVTDRLLLERIIAQHSVRIINVSMVGALIKGAEMQPLARVIENELTVAPTINMPFDEIAWHASPDNEKRNAELGQLTEAFKTLKTECDRLVNANAKIMRSRNKRNGSLLFQEEFLILKKKYLLFLQKYDKELLSLHDALIKELQDQIKWKETNTTAIGDVSKTKVMVDELEMMASILKAVNEQAESVVSGLETTLEALT